jgi:pullulanase/glycogen debranching enzyme
MPNIRATESKRFLGKILDLFRPVRLDTDEFSSHADKPNNSLSFIKAHLHHAIVDVVVNLLGLAVIINSL